MMTPKERAARLLMQAKAKEARMYRLYTKAQTAKKNADYALGCAELRWKDAVKELDRLEKL